MEERKDSGLFQRIFHSKEKETTIARKIKGNKKRKVEKSMADR